MTSAVAPRVPNADPRAGTPDIRRVLSAAWPVMLGYVTIGIPCGILCSQAGMAAWMCLLMSCTFYSGAGQFMLPGLWIAGMGIPSIVASVAFVSSRQMLYSAAFSRYFARATRLMTFAFSATVTDESFGVNTERFSADSGWRYSEGTLVNVSCMLTWAGANFVGALVGDAVAIPSEIAAFAMTSIFVCLLVEQSFDASVLATAIVAFVGVWVAKAVGLASVSIVLSAVLAIGAGMLVKKVRRA